MKKIFISQPMNGLTDEEILETRKNIQIRAEKEIGESVELIDSFITEDPDKNNNIPVWYLGKSILCLCKADIAYFGGDWKSARGCNIEHEIAVQYGVDRIEE